MMDIEDKVNEIIAKLGLDYPALPNNTVGQRVVQKLDIIKAGISVKDVMKEVKTVTEILNDLYIADKSTDKTENTSSEEILSNCTSIGEIEMKAAEFK